GAVRPKVNGAAAAFGPLKSRRFHRYQHVSRCNHPLLHDCGLAGSGVRNFCRGIGDRRDLPTCANVISDPPCPTIHLAGVLTEGSGAHKQCQHHYDSCRPHGSPAFVSVPRLTQRSQEKDPSCWFSLEIAERPAKRIITVIGLMLSNRERKVKAGRK